MQTILEKLSVKTQFVQALRSGQYEQLTDGRMSDGRRLCAMGVFQVSQGDINFEFPISNHDVMGVPVAVFNRIAELNDSGRTFNEIADYIERAATDNLSGLTY